MKEGLNERGRKKEVKENGRGIYMNGKGNLKNGMKKEGRKEKPHHPGRMMKNVEDKSKTVLFPRRYAISMCANVQPIIQIEFLVTYWNVECLR